MLFIVINNTSNIKTTINYTYLADKHIIINIIYKEGRI